MMYFPGSGIYDCKLLPGGFFYPFSFPHPLRPESITTALEKSKNKDLKCLVSAVIAVLFSWEGLGEDGPKSYERARLPLTPPTAGMYNLFQL